MKRTVQWRWISWLEIVMMYTYVMLPVREMDCFHQIKEPPFDWAFHSSGRHNYWQAVRPSGSLCISSSSPQTELISQNQDRKPAAAFHPPPSPPELCLKIMKKLLEPNFLPVLNYIVLHLMTFWGVITTVFLQFSRNGSKIISWRATENII